MEICALPHWQQIDFISDLHLQVEFPRTFNAWCNYLQHTTADAVFVLGDLFEVWVGDDVLSTPQSFEARCAAALHEAGKRLTIYIMHGNRDFLMGQALMSACNATLINDPCVLIANHARWLLTHGDALCIDDTSYMQFRTQVRGSAWQENFLRQSLSARLDTARHLRMQSEARKHAGEKYADADTATALQWLKAHQAQHMIHGHTHQPALHSLGDTHCRWVLSDWDLHATPARAEVLRMFVGKNNQAQANRLERLTLAQTGLNSPSLPG